MNFTPHMIKIFSPAKFGSRYVNESELDLIRIHLPKYIESTPLKQYRKNPDKFDFKKYRTTKPSQVVYTKNNI